MKNKRKRNSEEFKEYNRELARKSRIKKAKMWNDLKEDNKSLQEDNKNLHDKVNKLNKLVNEYQFILNLKIPEQSDENIFNFLSIPEE